jgi:hypothetical protein
MTHAVRQPDVSFIVPVRDDVGSLRQCLASIRANCAAGELEMIVIDNGSRDQSAAVAREAGAIVMTTPVEPVAAVRNEGAVRATGRLLAFVDADHVIDSSWAATVIEVLADPNIAAVGAPYLPPPDVNWVQRAYDRFRSHRKGVHEVEWLGSGNLAIRRALFLQVGGFDASLETCEDVDLCNRLRAARHRIVSDDRLRSVHYGDPDTLRAVFLGELWRGRDNLRASLRGPVTVRSMPSVAIPIVSLALLVSAVLGVFMLPWDGAPLLMLGVLGFLFLSLCRAGRMTCKANRGVIREFGANLAVACVYDCARALALVAKVGHRTRARARA